ncbi:MCE family protein [Mycobacteroides abscessus subsp. bolletii]|uniref:MlaD family protein n=1 Tax=Mycobacteroides abscessus TaxID=36809 RepID=UPI0019D2D98B|nr:MlaD family protein [Mycobacteroides abscessus]MBN7303131.1 MCE family protein [Mycobacteroides abscessus subsp. bolletii]
MQRVIRSIRRVIAFALGNARTDDKRDRRRQLMLGMIGLLAVAIAMASSAVIYFAPLGKRTYTAEVAEASSIKAGDQVRVAGIVVGDVRSVQLQDDSVKILFTVDRKIFVGAQTTLEIRLLTPVGGHYVTVFPAGNTPLGTTPIPADRVKLPYNLGQALQDAIRPVKTIDGDILRKNFTALADALDKQPGAIRAMGDAVSSVVGVLNRQNSDVRRSLDIADEYLSLLARSRGIIGQMLTKIGTMETTILSRRAEVLETLRVVTELLSRIAALEPNWREQLQPLTDALLQAWPQWRELVDRLAGLGDSLNRVWNRVDGYVGKTGEITIDQSGQSISPRPVCIPMPGRTC